MISPVRGVSSTWFACCWWDGFSPSKDLLSEWVSEAASLVEINDLGNKWFVSASDGDTDMRVGCLQSNSVNYQTCKNERDITQLTIIQSILTIIRDSLQFWIKDLFKFIIESGWIKAILVPLWALSTVQSDGRNFFCLQPNIWVDAFSNFSGALLQICNDFY